MSSGDDRDTVPVPRSAVARKRNQRVNRRARQTRRSAEWLNQPRYVRAVLRHASLGTIFDGLVENICQFGLTNELGEVRSVVESARRVALALLQHEREMLLTPLASAQAPRTLDVFEKLIHPMPDDAEVVADAPEVEADGRRLP
ncbi:MAG TPA: hypothetical protein VJX68_02385 [Candidatus Binatus sp.]|uniref:hypothetical protein n=1 Tax=Candidatus Binatus sp. TaxID=2811406 RepID=UPI002B479F02|nr:hypothetical protein [Candidatus Binatus sp.]HKN12017.1 hypothetical protein [Candidatus Binatus sp.]